jgi:TrpR-related protein YerC/YecD
MKKSNKTDNLYEAILALKNQSEAKRFFRDLLTEGEILEFGSRWQAAQMLDKKKTYPEIIKSTGLSTRTIARISQWLKNGRGGYRIIINRFEKKHSGLSGKRPILPR